MFSRNRTSASAPDKADLRRLFMLRNVAIVGQGVTVALTVALLEIPLRLTDITLIIGALALFNAVTWIRLHKNWQVSHQVFFMQLLVDVLALTGLLYFAGGATNPFVSLYLIPLTISATVLPGRATWMLSTIAVLLYTALMHYYIPLPHMNMDTSQFGMHVFGMWLGFVLSAGIIAYFVVGMGRTLRHRDSALAAAREQALRDRQLVELGTLAASTAHELGTPLGTMALLASELKEEYANQNPVLQERITELQSQITRCKTALSTLTTSSGNVHLDGGGAMPIDSYLNSLYTEWLKANPDVNIQTDWDGEQPAPTILVDRTLSQAITNILDNAADVSPQSVGWQARWNTIELIMEIRDCGSGITAEAKRHIGKVPYTAKPEGLGLGLFLAYAIIERFGGEVTFFNRKEGGSCTRIVLPCTQLAGKTL